MKKIRLFIFIVLFIIGCSPKIQPVAGGKKVKEKKPLTTIVMFSMVGSFMLGYCLTNEYLIEK